MSIQQNINQAISIASLLASQTQRAADVKQAKTLSGIDTAAFKGLKDIEGNLERTAMTEEAIESGDIAFLKHTGHEKELKHYSEEELTNIRSRRRKLINDIYDVKTARLNPRLSKFIEVDRLRQPEIAASLDRMASYEARAEAAKESKIHQQMKSKDFINLVSSLDKKEGV